MATMVQGSPTGQVVLLDENFDSDGYEWLASGAIRSKWGDGYVHGSWATPLLLQPLDLAGLADASIELDLRAASNPIHYEANGAGADSFAIEVSYDGGATFETLDVLRFNAATSDFLSATTGQSFSPAGGSLRYALEVGGAAQIRILPNVNDTREFIAFERLTVSGTTEQATAAEPGFAAEYFITGARVSSLDEIDFSASPVATGTVAALDYMDGSEPFWDGGPENRFAARYTAELSVETGGRYSFFLTSDDGSRLSIDGAVAIDNDGRHGTIERQVTLDLAAGTHALEVLYFEDFGGQTLSLEWAGADTGGARTLLSGDAIGLPGTSPEPQPEPEPVNAAPVANDDTVSVDEGGTILVDVLGNDSDPDGDALTVTGVTGAANGRATVEGGQIRYTPDAGFSGAETLTYTASDGRGGTDTALVEITVDPLPEPEPEPPAPADPGFAAEYFVVGTGLSSLSQIDFSDDPVATDTVSALDYMTGGDRFWAGGPEDGFAAVYTAALTVATAGAYTFYLSSDDGSRLSLEGQVLIDNDGLQAVTELSATLDLGAGTYALEVLYFENTGLQNLALEWAGPDTGGARTLLTGSALGLPEDDPAPEPEPEPEPEPVNTAPVAADDTARLDEGATVLVDVLGNDTDPDGDALSILALGGAANGAATVEGDRIRYTPDAGFSGSETLSYTVSDGRGGTDTALIDITVDPLPEPEPVNTAPVAVGDTATLEEGGTLLIDVLGNDSDPDGDALTITGVSSPANGTATVEGGRIRYTPDAGFSGNESLSYTVADGRGGGATALVTVEVTAAASELAPPSLGDDVVFVGHSLVNNDMPAMLEGAVEAGGGAGEVLAQVIPGAPLRWNWDNGASAQTNARAELATGDIEVLVLTEALPLLNHVTWNDSAGYAKLYYDLAVGSNPGARVYLYETWHSLDSGTGVDVPYDDNDHIPWRERLDQDLAVWEGIVDHVNTNRVPGQPEMLLVPAGQALARLHDEIEAGLVPGLSDISDIFIDDIHLTDVGNYFVAMVQYATIYGGDPADLPTQFYNEWGQAFDAPDPALADKLQEVAWATVREYPRSGVDDGAALDTPEEDQVNLDPEALADEGVTEAGTAVLIDVLGNDTDPDGDALSLTGVSDPANGAASVESGQILYTPDAGFSGTETFTYAVSDGSGGSANALVTVEVVPAGEPDPAPSPDDGTASGLVADYFALPAAVSSLAEVDFSRTPDATGTLASLARTASDTPFWDGGPTDDFAARYTGALNIATAGRYTFHLTSDDGSALSIDGQRVIDNDGLHGDLERSVTLDLAAGAHAIEILYFERGGLQTLELEWTGPDTGGQRTVISGAAFSQGGGAPAPEPEPEPVNRAPDAVADEAATEAGVSVLIDALANDIDPDGDPLSLTAVSAPAGGTAEIIDGMIRYTPDTGFSGTETLTYTVEDGRGGSDTASVTVDVAFSPAPSNTAPVALDDSVEGVLTDGMWFVLASALLANDSDADGDALSLVDFDGAMQQGSDIMVTAPVTDGTASFTYTVSDGRGGTDTATVTMTVPDGADPGDGGHGDHGGGCPMTGDAVCSCDLPETPEEIEAFVQGVLSGSEDHAHHDAHPDDPAKAGEHMALLDLVPHAEATHIAIGHGSWFDPDTWYEGRVPDAGARVVIPEGVCVTYDGISDSSLFTVRVDGKLSFATDADSSMLVDTMVVAPSGTLEMGTAANPMAPGASAEIVIANNGDIDTTWDPSLLSRGVISHGSVEIHGAEKTSFLTVDTAPMAGDTEIRLSETPDGWQVGDRIVLTGTHKQGWTWTGSRVEHVESEDEEVFITAINGNTVTIDRPLEHDHDVPRDDLAAYVANMTRNVTFRSEDGEDTAVHHRGHTMFMHSDDVDVRYAAFDDLGRTDKSVEAGDASYFGTLDSDTNVKGRYSFHFHRTGTEDQENPAIALGNAVTGSPGWGFVHHSSHANFVENVSFDVFGAHFAAEDGDETGTWLRNLAIQAEGIGYGDWTVKEAGDVGRHDNGRTGDGFFFAGRLVEAEENVAANTTNGFVWLHRGPRDSPLSENLDQPEVAYGSEYMRIDQAPIHGFRDNEAFGTQSGVIVIKSDARQEHDVRTVMDGFLNWETSVGMDISYTSHYTIMNVDVIGTRNTAPVADPEFGFKVGTNTYDLVINGINIEGFPTGISTTNTHTFPVTDDEARLYVIDPAMTNVDAEYGNFPAARLELLNSSDLEVGRLQFDMQGDTTISRGEELFFDGVKTDSIGSRERHSDSMDDYHRVNFYNNLVPLLQEDGYYETSDGRNVMILEDFVADRATGELLKLSHVITLAMSTSELASLGATNRGLIDLASGAPAAIDDVAFTSAGAATFIDVLANDSDPDGDVIQVDGMDPPSNGEVHEQEDGRLLYVPDPGFSGTESFTYWVTDGMGNFTPGTVTVEVTAEDAF